MTIKDIAARLIELNHAHEYETCYQELFSPEVVSVENWGDREEFVGLDAIKAKGEQWQAMLEETHELKIGEPIIADHSFALTFYMDVTFKAGTPGMEGRQQFTELAIYRVNSDGKIYHEEFVA
jgi:hypothetical protein